MRRATNFSNKSKLCGTPQAWQLNSTLQYFQARFMKNDLKVVNLRRMMNEAEPINFLKNDFLWFPKPPQTNKHNFRTLCWVIFQTKTEPKMYSFSIITISSPDTKTLNKSAFSNRRLLIIWQLIILDFEIVLKETLPL